MFTLLEQADGEDVFDRSYKEGIMDGSTWEIRIRYTEQPTDFSVILSFLPHIPELLRCTHGSVRRIRQSSYRRRAPRRHGNGGVDRAPICQ